MSTTLAADVFIPASQARPSSRIRRIAALAAAELRLHLRAGTALVTAVLMPPVTVLALLSLGMGEGLNGGALTTLVVAMMAAWMILLAVFHNLTAVYVARREDRVFKRLVTGEATINEVVIAGAVPAGLILAIQMALTLVVAGVAIGMPSFANPLLAVIGLVGGVVALLHLAAATSGFTASVEAAQYSTLPLLMVFVFFSGTNFPLQYMPEWLQTLAQWTPVNAVCELVTIGLTGATMAGEASTGFLDTFALGSTAIACLVVWCVVGYLAAVRFLRTDPRR